MTETAATLWEPHIEKIADLCRRSPRVVAQFHLPKTGGTTLERAAGLSTAWQCVILPSTYLEPAVCNCGRKGCAVLAKRAATLKFDRFLDTGVDVDPRPIYLKFGHETFASVRWLIDRLAERDLSVELFTMVRPVRRRLVSMFTDYWTRVFVADRYRSGEIDLTPHELGVAMNYFNDALHYRDGRVINGATWFRAFAQHGGGIPFFLSEVFGAPSELAEVLASGVVRAIPIEQLDQFTAELLNDAPAERRRVSVTPSSALSAAIKDARGVIDEMVARELPWDRVLAVHLGDGSFVE